VAEAFGRRYAQSLLLDSLLRGRLRLVIRGVLNTVGVKPFNAIIARTAKAFHDGIFVDVKLTRQRHVFIGIHNLLSLPDSLLLPVRVVLNIVSALDDVDLFIADSDQFPCALVKIR
jgi:hypothetical protein